MKLAPGSKVAQIYGAESVEERHRHRYEFDFEYQAKFEEGGAVLSGKTETGNHLEVMELPNHPWFVAVAYHPEFKSQPTKPHPLFADFVAAAVKHRA